jgi:hypothetical protein
MACWHWNRQVTQPPPAARRRRVASTVTATSTAARAAPAVATATAAIRSAVPKKLRTGRPNTRKTTNMTAASLQTGRT